MNKPIEPLYEFAYEWQEMGIEDKIDVLADKVREIIDVLNNMEAKEQTETLKELIATKQRLENMRNLALRYLDKVNISEKKE